MKQHLKRFAIGFGVMVAMNVIYSANVRGIVNVTACLSCGVAGGLIYAIGYNQYLRHKNGNDTPKEVPKDKSKEEKK